MIKFKLSAVIIIGLLLVQEAYAQNKVVVIPSQGDSATPNVTFVAFGIVERSVSNPTFSMLSLPSGVNASVSNDGLTRYTISLSGYQGTLNPVIFLTPMTSVSGDDDYCNTHISTSSTPGSYTAVIQCYPGRPAFLHWMIMG